MIMPKERIAVMVEGGKATPAPPLGPALGPLKVNVQEVVNEINRKTKDMKGMQVPVKVIVDTVTKKFEVEVGSPPATALIKKELGLDKGSSETGKVRVGDLTMDQVRKIASAKFGSADDRYVNQITGTARSMGITIGRGALTEEEVKAVKESRKRATKEAAAAAAAPAEGEATAPVAVPEPKKEEKPKEEKARRERKGKN